MSTAPAVPAETKRTAALREDLKLARAQVGMLAAELEVALSIIGRQVGDGCPNCLGEIPIGNCFRCSRVKRILDALKAVGR